MAVFGCQEMRRIGRRISNWWPNLSFEEEALWFSLARIRRERTELGKGLVGGRVGITETERT